MALLLKWWPNNNLELFENCGLDGALKERVEGWNTELRSLSTSKFLQLHEAVCAEILEANQSVAIYAQASDRRDQGPSPDGVADDYAAADRGGGGRGYFAAGHTTASVDAWALGIEKNAVLVGVWKDHGVGVALEFDSSENYAEAHRSAATQVSGAAGLSRT